MSNWKFTFENVLDMDNVGVITFGRRVFVGWRHAGPKKEGDRYPCRGVEVCYGVRICIRCYWDSVLSSNEKI